MNNLSGITHTLVINAIASIKKAQNPNITIMGQFNTQSQSAIDIEKTIELTSKAWHDIDLM